MHDLFCLVHELLKENKSHDPPAIMITNLHTIITYDIIDMSSTRKRVNRSAPIMMEDTYHMKLHAEILTVLENSKHPHKFFNRNFERHVEKMWSKASILVIKLELVL